MKIPEKEAVAKHFQIPHNELKTMIQYLSAIRNCCAHSNRLYCYNSRTPLVDTIYHSQLGITKNAPTADYKKEEYVCGKRDLFATVLALKCLLSEQDFDRLALDLAGAFKGLKPRLSVITMEDIKKEMGFPENWLDLSPSTKTRINKKRNKIRK